MRFQRGDIVWARVIYPQTWYPGLVSTTDILGISVSFFNIIKPRYFVESEVRSFKENFEPFVKTIKCSTGQALLDYVLLLIAKRAVSSLLCPCLLESENVRRKNRSGDVGFLFCANSVVGFVHRLGVFPLVEDSDFLCAVSLVSQVQMFRRFLVTQQKLLLNEEAIKERQNVDDGVCLSDSGKAMHSVAKKSVTSELELETLQEVIPKSGLLTQTKQTKPQPLNEMLASFDCLASDALTMRKDCSNTVKQSYLMFGNLSCQSTSNLELRKRFHTRSDIQFSYPECVGSQSSVELDGKAAGGDFGPLVPYAASPINFTGLKRHDDPPADSCFVFKLRKIIPLFSVSKADDHLQEKKPESSVHISDILISSPAFSGFRSKFCNIEPSLPSAGGDAHLQSRTGFEAGAAIQGCHSMQLFQDMLSVNLAKDASYGSNTLELNKFQENKYYVDTLNDSGTCLPFDEMQKPGEIITILKDGETLKPFDDDAVEKIENGIQIEDMDASKLVLQLPTSEPVINYVMETCSGDKMGNASAASKNFLLSDMPTNQNLINCRNGDDATSGAIMIASPGDSSIDNKERCQPGTSDPSFKPQVAQQSPFGAFANSKTCSENDKIVNANAANSNCLPYELNTDQIQMKPTNSDDIMSVETSRVSIISSFGDSVMNNEELYQPGTADQLVKGQSAERSAIGAFSSSMGGPDQPLKSNVSEQSAVSTFSSSTSLHMKFPKDFNLPSKMALIRKFSRFGRVEPLKTKVYQRMGSAQVVFYDELDAMAAYQYAKRKKVLFGDAVVLYWLDRCEHKRRGSNFLSRMSSSNLKPSLKNSTRRGKEDKKCSRRVRFTIET